MKRTWLVSLTASLFVALSLLLLHQYYPLSYIAQVFIRQDSDTDDFQWKKGQHFPPSPNPRPFRRNMLDETVRTAFEIHPEVSDLDLYMENLGSTALVILKDGELIYERYYQGSAPEILQGTMSVTKSVFSILFGQAIARGDIHDIDNPVARYVPELGEAGSDFAPITLAHLIDMRSGLGYEANPGFPFFDGDAALIYYSNDLPRTVLRFAEIKNDPPGPFHYNDYNPILLGMALGNTSDGSPIQHFLPDIWEPIGAEYPAVWATDKNGFPFLESGFAATPRDLAKIGQLLLDGGKVESRVLIPETWLNRTTSYRYTGDPLPYDGRQWSYKNGWWLILREDGQHDLAAIGRYGQFIYISAKNNVVIIRTGPTRNGASDIDLTEIFFSAANHL